MSEMESAEVGATPGPVDAPDGGGESALVLAPSMDGVGEPCADLVGDGRGTDLLLVSLTGAPDRRLDELRTSGAGRPDRVATISCDATRGASASATPAPGSGPYRSCTVSDPGDLTGIGIRIDQCLEGWAGAPTETVLCFHSLTAVLQYVPLTEAFRFCHVLTRRTARAGVTARFHLDPTTVDDQTVRTLRPLFDLVVDRT